MPSAFDCFVHSGHVNAHTQLGTINFGCEHNIRYPFSRAFKLFQDFFKLLPSGKWYSTLYLYPRGNRFVN